MTGLMNRTFALSLALAAAAAFPLPLAAQTNAADAAEQVAQQASGAFERDDPDQDIPAAGEAALIFAVLPPIAPEPAVETVIEAPALLEPPRGPAIREIAREVVQPLPVNAAAPASRARKPSGRTGSNDPLVIKSILPIEGTIRYGDWFWDESAAPGVGKLVITVDLDARVISAFRDGHEIGTAVVLLGTQEHPTPLGVFPILTKEKDNVSEKYDNAPMPWTLRLTWGGIAIHGSPVLNGYASHGCVGVPDEFAAKLFAAAKRGDKVIITRGQMVGVGDKVL